MALFSVSCCPCNKISRSSHSLASRTWSLVQFAGTPVKTDGASYTIIFHEDGTLRGKGDCNSLMGKYSLFQKRNALTVSITTATKMACRDQQRENEFIRVLNTIDTYGIDSKMLMLMSGGNVVAVFEAIGEKQNRGPRIERDAACLPKQ